MIQDIKKTLTFNTSTWALFGIFLFLTLGMSAGIVSVKSSKHTVSEEKIETLQNRHFENLVMFSQTDPDYPDIMCTVLDSSKDNMIKLDFFCIRNGSGKIKNANSKHNLFPESHYRIDRLYDKKEKKFVYIFYYSVNTKMIYQNSVIPIQ